MQGRRIATLMEGDVPAGVHRVTWRTEDDQGNRVGAGVYFYVLETPRGVETRKMVVIK